MPDQYVSFVTLFLPNFLLGLGLGLGSKTVSHVSRRPIAKHVLIDPPTPRVYPLSRAAYEVMSNPVLCADTITYEESAIRQVSTWVVPAGSTRFEERVVPGVTLAVHSSSTYVQRTHCSLLADNEPSRR